MFSEFEILQEEIDRELMRLLDPEAREQLAGRPAKIFIFGDFSGFQGGVHVIGNF